MNLKTLRVMVRDGWQTKPVAPGNSLTAAEVDATFLGVVDDYADQTDPLKGAGMVGVSPITSSPSITEVLTGTLREVLQSIVNRIALLFAGDDISVYRFMTAEQIADTKLANPVLDHTTAINNAVTYALSKYQRQIDSVGGSFPAKMKNVVFPSSGIFNYSGVLVPVATNYGVCKLKGGNGRATMRFTNDAACIYLNPVDTGLTLMTSPCAIEDMHFFRANKNSGTAGIIVERMTNGMFKNVSTYGGYYGIKVDGAIDCEFDFGGFAIEHCVIGMQIQQKTGLAGIMKPNLTTIKNAYFIDCSSGSLVIRRNPDESMTNNGSGGIISVEWCNFQGGSSGPAINAEYLGENPGTGGLHIKHTWFEGHGNTAVSATASDITMSHVFCLDGSDPVILNDQTSRVHLEDVEFFRTTTPTLNACVKRTDGTTDLYRQVTTRNARVTVSGVPTVKLTVDNIVMRDHVYGARVIGDVLNSYTGTTASLTTGAGATIYTASSGGIFLVVVKQGDGGIVWRGSWLVTSSGGSLGIVTIESVNCTLTASGAAMILTNTNASAQSFNWSIMQVHRG